MTSEPTALRHRRAIDALHTRLSGLDLRDVLGTILGVAGTIMAVIQFTSLERPAEIAMVIVETALITSIFVILPPREERLKRKHKNITSSEKTALFAIAALAVLIWYAAVQIFTVTNAVPIRAFDPFTFEGNIRPEFRVNTVRGDCWELSQLDRRSDAWRCISGNVIHDPCFSYSTSSVACAEDPWATDITKIVLTSPLNWRLAMLSSPDSGAPFWAMTLTSGVECVILPGATSAIDGSRVNYTCQDGYIVSSVDASSATAQVLAPGAATFGTEGVLVGWN